MHGISPAPHLRPCVSTISAYQLLVTYVKAARSTIRDFFLIFLIIRNSAVGAKVFLQ